MSDRKLRPGRFSHAFVALGVIVALSSCGSSSSSGGGSTPANANGITIVMSAAGMGSMAYSPGVLTVAPGTTVTWTNSDSTNHTVTSNTSVFNSGTMSAGATFSYTFSTVGTYPYHCNVHPSMTGTVMVQ